MALSCTLDADPESSLVTALLHESRSRNTSNYSELRLDTESQHHATLVVLGDVAMGHPEPGPRDLQENVDRLAGRDEDRVLPDEVRFHDSVARKNEETAGAMDVEGVMHWVIGVHLVDQSNLHLVPDPKPPVDLPSFGACRPIDQLPTHVARRGQPVHIHHVVFPLDPACLVSMLTAAMLVRGRWMLIGWSSVVVMALSSCTNELCR
jgi:hypothetical protein